MLISNQPDNAANRTVTVKPQHAPRAHGRPGSRHTAKSGQISVVTMEDTAKARCHGVGPLAASGEAATPMVDKPARISSRRPCDGALVRPRLVANWQLPTPNNAAVITHRSVAV